MAQAHPRAQKGMGMEGFVARWYARQTAHDADEFMRTARRIAGDLKPGDRVLEIAPGPGYLAIELAKRITGRVTALDINRTFVALVAENARNAGVAVDVEHGDAAAMPFAADQFDFIVCRAAFKNFTQPLAALNEMHRVLKPGGAALIIDLRKDFSPQAINDYVRGRGVFNAFIIKLTFNMMLKKRAYMQESLLELVTRSRFGHGEVKLDPIGFELRLQK